MFLMITSPEFHCKYTFRPYGSAYWAQEVTTIPSRGYGNGEVTTFARVILCE